MHPWVLSQQQGAVASEDFRGKENFLKKVFLPPNPHSFKNFNEGSKRMFCLTKYLSQSPFFEKFLKSEGGVQPLLLDSPFFVGLGILKMQYQSA